MPSFRGFPGNPGRGTPANIMTSWGGVRFREKSRGVRVREKSHEVRVREKSPGVMDSWGGLIESGGHDS